MNEDETRMHLNAYTQVNESHHDNIDDTQQMHTHTHKHSEDGEEHEHNHEHLKISQHEIKALSHSKIIKITYKEFNNNRSFIEKTFTSTPPPIELLRPPIS